MTITPEQLDELERRAREALEAETAYDVDPTQLTESHLIVAHEKMLLAAGDGATPPMPGATILRLVSVYRAALAWNEARDEMKGDAYLRCPAEPSRDVQSRMTAAAEALDAALRGKP